MARQMSNLFYQVVVEVQMFSAINAGIIVSHLSIHHPQLWEVHDHIVPETKNTQCGIIFDSSEIEDVIVVCNNGPKIATTFQTGK